MERKSCLYLRRSLISHRKCRKDSSQELHSWRLTWNLKITQLQRKIIFPTSSFWFYVNFPGCRCGTCFSQTTSTFFQKYLNAKTLPAHPRNPGSIKVLRLWWAEMTAQQGSLSIHFFWAYLKNPCRPCLSPCAQLTNAAMVLFQQRRWHRQHFLKLPKETRREQTQQTPMAWTLLFGLVWSTRLKDKIQLE